MEEFKVKINNGYYPVIKFGNGDKILSVISGVSLTSLLGKGQAIEKAYSVYKKDFTVFIFDRLEIIPENYSVSDMGEDLISVLNELKIEKTYLYGVSQGGMIAQYVAHKYPEKIEKLVLASSIDKSGLTMKRTAKRWIRFSKKEDVEGLNRYFYKTVYSKAFLEKIENKEELYKIGTKDDIKRFKVLARACKNYRGYEIKAKIPTLVIGNKVDKVLGFRRIKKLAKKLNAETYYKKEFSHAIYDEDKDLIAYIKNFLLLKK